MEELRKYPDDFITVKMGDEEYVIENVGHTKIHGDLDCESHICLNVKFGGEGFIKR